MTKDAMSRLFKETMYCGGLRPTVEVFDDGSVVISDDDAEAGSVGTIKIRPEAMARLITLLSTTG